jgi:sec-independent protein translocase protein TatB
MFDIGFGELFICFTLALIVLGPERLPKLARTLGQWTARAKGYFHHLSAELDKESHASELRKQLQEAQQLLQNQKQELSDQLRQPLLTAQAMVQQPQAVAEPLAAPIETTGETVNTAAGKDAVS